MIFFDLFIDFVLCKFNYLVLEMLIFFKSFVFELMNMFSIFSMGVVIFKCEVNFKNGCVYVESVGCVCWFRNRIFKRN